MLNTEINVYNTELLDWQYLLPHPISTNLLFDAALLNVDPIILWQYLLPTTLSVVGKKVNLDLGSHEIPAIVWTSVIGESGIGKTRAKSLILEPLQQFQDEEDLRYQLELKDYKKAMRERSDGDSEPFLPQKRQWFFDVARIQGVMKRLSEQGDNGSLWVRDEMPGLFKTVGQFSSKGDSEALECLLNLWDGKGAKVDRVVKEDSYIMIKSRLSLVWGIQPEIFKKIFKDPQETQGLQARFLYAAPKILPQKRIKGSPQLPPILLKLYRFLDDFPQGIMTLSESADSYYENLVEDIAILTEKDSNLAIRAWTRKLSGQVLRTAMGLHFLECFCLPDKPLWTLEKSTLEKAAIFGVYYLSTFNMVQNKLVEKQDLDLILLKIWTLALKSDITPRECCRRIRAITSEAKSAGLPPTTYTLHLFDLLEKDGKGYVKVVGRTVKFTAKAKTQAE